MLNLTDNQKDILESTYYNPSTGFVGENKLWAKVIKEDPTLTHKQVKDWLKQQSVVQEFKSARKLKSHHPIVDKITYPFSRCQIDLLEMGREPGQNYGKKFIFVAIDCYSRYVLTKNLVNKTTGDCVSGLKMLIDFAKSMNFKINQIDFDRENGFMSREFQQILQDNNIVGNPSTIITDKSSQAFVERMNLTIRQMYAKYKVAFHKYDWINVIPKLIKNYNNTVHSSTKLTPVESIYKFKEFPFESVSDHNTQVQSQINTAVSNNNARRPSNKDILQIGDRVRLRKLKEIFDKSSDTTKFTNSIHTILSKSGIYYSVSERKTVYKAIDLQKIDVTPQQNPYVKQSDMEQSDQIVNNHKRMRRITQTLERQGIAPSGVY